MLLTAENATVSLHVWDNKNMQCRNIYLPCSVTVKGKE